MNDPIKVRQPGGVLEFVQIESGDWTADSDTHKVICCSHPTTRSLHVFDLKTGACQIEAYDNRPDRTPTMLFAIAETIHKQLTGTGVSSASEEELDAEIDRIAGAKPAESVNAELLEALKRGRIVAERYWEQNYKWTNASQEAWDDLVAPLDSAIALAEAQQ